MSITSAAIEAPAPGAILRTTLLVSGPLAMREARLAAARDQRHGLQVVTIEQLAARLAGGFLRPIDGGSLRTAIQKVIETTPMGELEPTKKLPGMVRAAAETLNKVWRAGILLSERTGGHARLLDLARLEAAVVGNLPPGMMRPVDLANAAIRRVAHAPTVFGPIEIVGFAELSPCWRPLIKALAAHVQVSWNAGPRDVPEWLGDMSIRIVQEPPQTPGTEMVSAATAYHEAVEAMRWVRRQLASGVEPSQIAIAAASPADYDDHLLALRSEANIDLHFVHGVQTLSTREGQAAAALADIVVRGLSQSRFRRLASLCSQWSIFANLPEGWRRILPADSPLTTTASWERLLARLKPENWPDGRDHTPVLRAAIERLSAGPGAAAELGEAFLRGRALTVWRKALQAGPATALDSTLENLRQEDGLDACTTVAWMPASALAASPRHHVRLLGLNSSRWPRGISEDPLLPDHVLPARELDPLPIHRGDRRDFETILKTTRTEIVLSRARRDGEGRLLGRSPLLDPHAGEIYLRRHAIPSHAFSGTDRLMARPEEFCADPQAKGARACWNGWRSLEITAHDGLVRANHPLLIAVLDRTQSASSLRSLLRNPLEFAWHYALGWSAPKSSSEPLVLESLELGDLFHRVFDRALRDLEGQGGLNAPGAPIEKAARSAAEAVAAEWEVEMPVPPTLVWKRTLETAARAAIIALRHRDEGLGAFRSYGEVPFGGAEPKSEAPVPWDAGKPVEIPAAGFRIKGYIDRLDISEDRMRAHVCDYKTGKPLADGVRVHGGRELQRCLYAFAVKALLGEKVEISASLFYPLKDVERPLEHPEVLLEEISAHLGAARCSLAGGAALPGPDTGGEFDELAFALPANASATYCKRKALAAVTRIGDAARIWEAT